MTTTLPSSPETKFQPRPVANKLASAACWATIYAGVTVAQPQAAPLPVSAVQMVLAPTQFQVPTRHQLNVAALRRSSGLSWQQIADAIGVSRRAVHYWANGGNISALHRSRLEELAAEVQQLGYLEPQEVRARLTDPSGEHQSLLERMASGHRRDRAPQPTAVDRMFASDPELPGEEVGTPARSRRSKFDPSDA